MYIRTKVSKLVNLNIMPIGIGIGRNRHNDDADVVSFNFGKVPNIYIDIVCVRSCIDRYTPNILLINKQPCGRM